MKNPPKRLFGNKGLRVPRIFRINATPGEVARRMYRGVPPPKPLQEGVPPPQEPQRK